ncbi:MAG TPA: DUF4407 domain-containing protein [Chitinophagaceae bacterium]|nr:DUF4407 domain-containing protein [Chitinophagaceae bacterium]
MAETNEGQSGMDRDEGLYTYDQFSGQPQADSGHFLWWCAGAHQRLLRRFPSEHTKYSGLGGVILATFFLASLSAGYALYSLFSDWTLAAGFGVAWGLIIFNLDRFLVSTMRKYGVSRRRQWTLAIPRLVLALLIGFTMARPLELKLFEQEIRVKMAENLHRKIQRNDSLLDREGQVASQTAQAERQRLVTRRQAIEDTLQRLQQAYLAEADGTGGSGQRGIRDLTRLKQEAYERERTGTAPELARLADAIRVQDSLLAEGRNAREAKRNQYEAFARSQQGFLERNKALSDLAAEEPSVRWSSLLIALLIILVEIAPVLSKMILPNGPYDVALAREELLGMAGEEEIIRRERDTVHQKKRKLFQVQREASEKLVEKLSDLQRKQIDLELEKWERGEWDPKDHRASMDEVLRKMKARYQFREEDLW